MYNFPQYKEDDQAEILRFMHEHPFVTIIAVDKKGRIEATQIPVMIDVRDEKIFLTGHVVKKSDHHKAMQDNPAPLIIFSGAHTYVSGTWYTSNLQQASTWNYVSLHARGTLRWMDEQE